jgi:hypothetical protein
VGAAEIDVFRNALAVLSDEVDYGISTPGRVFLTDVKRGVLPARTVRRGCSFANAGRWSRRHVPLPVLFVCRDAQAVFGP